ncbi:hypothetical protein GCM10010329_05150 [Streptomyces spiroverticillatus]|uniref:Uncharacterized protein n=1 Tax=Streptomyces finlayi TaxID=67296 RepID=A0A919C6Z6_9ACTN|nr:hypothetical protein [Streptomyces finlayi]GGZ88039.1 hypothetical protein GCM10010329_05150 [Streptomyces spiroverticillatus]GHC79136.1 hypothetical protein GCM10010334_05130 [Streptomyces finlayi]
MTQPIPPTVPPQGHPQPPGERYPVPPALSEASRLLCAGTYLDGGYRDAVIEELYVHEERVTAPSYGFDAARVLAHALRARRIELVWAGGTVVLWVLASVLTDGLFLFLLFPCVVLALATLLRGSARSPEPARLIPALLLRWYGRGVFAWTLLWLVARAFDDPESSEKSWLDDALAKVEDVFGGLLNTLDGMGTPALHIESRSVWVALVFLAALAVTAGVQRLQFARILAKELNPLEFVRRDEDRAEAESGAIGPRSRRMRALVAAEQTSPVIMYGTEDPFCGAGAPVDTWELAVELKPREGVMPHPLDNRTILAKVVPLVTALRVPSVHGDAVVDRLRELTVDECVFLPALNAGSFASTQGDPVFVRDGLTASVEEGGETRRHFLRIRVGGWGEEVVVTVFVRVHTQGGMLMLEIAPHVLPPIRPQFLAGTLQAHRYADGNALVRIAGGLADTPSAPVRALITLVRGANSGVRLLTGGQGAEPRTGPGFSVRERAATGRLSLFQDMDVSRYLKSIQDRVANGVKQALYEAGWQTGDFEQKVINVSDGGVVIDSVHNSALGFGAGARAHTTNSGPQGPVRGGNGNGRQ